MPAKKAKPKKKAVKKSAKKKAVKRPAKKIAKKSPKKAVKKKAAKKKVVKRASKKPAKKSVKKVAKKTAKPKKAVKTAKPKAPKAPKGTPITFVLDAPTGWDVALAGSFNNWEPRAMVKEQDGLWRITVHLAPGVYQYRFLVDTEWREDPVNERRTVNEYGSHNSVIEVG